jgi:flagellar assembly protein FliH
MPLMKETQVDQIAHEAIVLDLGDLRKQAESLMRQAHDEASRVLDEAHAQAKQLIDEAHGIGHAAGLEAGRAEGLEQGRAEGHAQALADMQQQLGQMEQGWTTALSQLEAQRREMMLDARHDVLTLALAIAEKIVKRVPQVDPSVIEDQLLAAIEQVARPSDLAISVNPAEAPLVTEALPRIIEQCQQAQHVELTTRDDIEPGGCAISYGRGRVDATLSTQLDRIVDALLPTGGSDTAEPTDPQDTPETDA